MRSNEQSSNQNNQFKNFRPDNQGNYAQNPNFGAPYNHDDDSDEQENSYPEHEFYENADHNGIESENVALNSGDNQGYDQNYHN
jgi:hypothetical protein